MFKPTLIYCYDAYCGWCFGFSPVMQQIASQYKGQLQIDVLSGGMLLPENKMPIEKIAPYLRDAYLRVEDLSGVKFGEDFLWHIHNPDKSDWVMMSEKPAIALSIFKEWMPYQQMEVASALQHALYVEGRDLDDDGAYLHLLERYQKEPDVFFEKLKSEKYKEEAYYDFALCKQLNATSFPQLFFQTGERKFHLIAQGYTPFSDVNARIEAVLAEI